MAQALQSVVICRMADAGPPTPRLFLTPVVAVSMTRTLVACMVAAVCTAPQAGTVHAQTIRGVATAEGENRQLAQAQISVIAAARDSVIATALSSDGRFLFDLPNAGRYRLRVQALGYYPLTTAPVNVAVATVVTLELRLKPDALALEPLVVLGERPEPPFMRDVRRRQSLGFGRLIERETLEQRIGSRLEDVLREAGMTVEYVPLGSTQTPLVAGRQAVNRMVSGDACYAALYLDGVRQFPSITRPTGVTGRKRDGTFGFDSQALENAAQLFDLRVQEIEAIEVYRSRVQAPPEWADGMSECGVVAVWLRSGYESPLEALHGVPLPRVLVIAAAVHQQLEGDGAPASGHGAEVAAHWHLRGILSAGARLRRSAHTLSPGTTADLLHGLDPTVYEVGAQERALSLIVFSLEPRVDFRDGAPVAPSLGIRVHGARRSFAVPDVAVARRSYTFESYAWGLGASAGVHLRLIGRAGLQVTAAWDRLNFGAFATLDRPGKATSAVWSGTVLGVGISARL